MSAWLEEVTSYNTSLNVIKDLFRNEQYCWWNRENCRGWQRANLLWQVHHIDEKVSRVSISWSLTSEIRMYWNCKCSVHSIVALNIFSFVLYSWNLLICFEKHVMYTVEIEHANRKGLFRSDYHYRFSRKKKPTWMVFLIFVVTIKESLLPFWKFISIGYPPP